MAGGTSEKRTDFLGGKYVQHYDEQGNKAGRSENRTDAFGKPYTQFYDERGNKTGTCEIKTDAFGKKYYQYYDNKGSKTGTGEYKTDVFGNKYFQHYNSNGDKIGTSEARTDFMGNQYTKRNMTGSSAAEKSSSGHRGGGGSAGGGAGGGGGISLGDGISGGVGIIAGIVVLFVIAGVILVWPAFYHVILDTIELGDRKALLQQALYILSIIVVTVVCVIRSVGKGNSFGESFGMHVRWVTLGCGAGLALMIFLMDGFLFWPMAGAFLISLLISVGCGVVGGAVAAIIQKFI